MHTGMAATQQHCYTILWLLHSPSLLPSLLPLPAYSTRQMYRSMLLLQLSFLNAPSLPSARHKSSSLAPELLPMLSVTTDGAPSPSTPTNSPWAELYWYPVQKYSPAPTTSRYLRSTCSSVDVLTSTRSPPSCMQFVRDAVNVAVGTPESEVVK